MVRYTLVPEARGWTFLDDVHGAVPESPEGVEDCCGHIQARTSIPSREHAREWLVFLEALDCVDNEPAGYSRSEKPQDPQSLAEPFETNLFGVREILAILAGESDPLTDRAVAEGIDESVRTRLDGGAGTHDSAGDAVERRLGWAQLFGLVSRHDGHYSLVVRQ